MKLAFIGSHGVGKTTLCFDLASKLKRLDLNVDIVREVARHCPLPINQETTLDAQAWILHSQVAWESRVAARFIDDESNHTCRIGGRRGAQCGRFGDRIVLRERIRDLLHQDPIRRTARR